MTGKASSYHGYRFPSEIISHAVWLYYRFCLSFRDVEDLLAERGVIVSHETIRQWCRKSGAEYARKLKRRQGRLGDTWHLDELFVTIQGQRQYLWRAVDQDGDVIDILVQPRRNRRAAERFFRKLLKGQGLEPLRLVTDKLRSYSAAHRIIMPSVIHVTETLRQQPGRSLPPADATARATDAQVQVRCSSATILVGPRSHPESLQGRTASAWASQPPDAASRLVPRLV